MNICICCLSDRPWLWSKTRPILEEYCKKHNYTFVFKDDSLDYSRAPSWSKLLMVEELLPMYDYVIWIDDDILITDMDKPITDFISVNNNKGITLQKDPNIRTKDINKKLLKDDINCGFMFFKNKPETLNLIKSWYKYCDINPSKAVQNNWEQDILVNYYNNIDKSEINIVEYRTFQSFHRGNDADYQWHPGDFSAHLTGICKRKRLQLIEQLLS